MNVRMIAVRARIPVGNRYRTMSTAAHSSCAVSLCARPQANTPNYQLRTIKKAMSYVSAIEGRYRSASVTHRTLGRHANKAVRVVSVAPHPNRTTQIPMRCSASLGRGLRV